MLVTLPYCFHVLPDQRDLLQMPHLGPFKCPYPHGRQGPFLLLFLAGLNDPAPHPAQAGDSSGWNSFQVTCWEPEKLMGRVVEGTKGVGKEVIDGVDKEPC